MTNYDIMDLTTGYIIGISVAFVIASLYFYYTYKNQHCYYDDQVEEINRNISRD